MSEHQPDSAEQEPLNDEKEDIFHGYIEHLELSPEDLSKKILDVGSNTGEFAKWAKEHSVSSGIVSLDPQAIVKKSPQGVRGVAEAIPFADGSFELVLAHASIPNLYSEEEPEAVEIKVRESLNEMLRVVQSGGEVRIGPVWRKFADYPVQGLQLRANAASTSIQRLREAVDVVLGELRAKGVGVELKNESHRVNKTPDGGLQEEESALIILKKP